jgi:serine/threonine protein phosphatase PrpC
MTRLKMVFGQFGLIGGICRASSDCILVEEPSPVSPAARWKGSLYILAEPVSEGSRGYQAARQVITEIARTYYASASPSITTCLARAIREANQSLFQHNMQVSGHEKITVGVTCAVVRGEELFIAQVLPGQAYIVHQGRVQAFPLSPSWDPEATTLPTGSRLFAVGWAEEVSIEFFHSPLQSGDGFCLCTSNIGRALGKEEAEEALLYQKPADVVEQLYRRIHQLGFAEAHAIVIELQPAISRQASSLFSKAGLQERAKIVGETLGAWGAFVAGEARRLFQRPKQAGTRPPRPAKSRPRPAPAPLPETPPLARPKPPEPFPRAVVSAVRRIFRPKSPYPALERPRMRIRAPKERRSVRPYVLGVLAIVVLVVLAVLIIRGTQQRQETLLNQLLEETSQKVASASQAADITESNRILDEAEQTLRQALDPNRSQPRIELALRDLQAERDRINHVVRLQGLDLVVDPRTFSSTMAAQGFTGACTDCSFRDLALIGENIYLLEGERGTVYLYSPVTSEVSPVIWPGMQAKGHEAGAIVAIAALEHPKDCLPGETSETWLAAIDANRWLYLQHQGQWEAYVLSSESTWTDQSVGLAGYQGNVYVFKGEPDQVLKYYCNAYELRPESWIKDPRQVQMNDAVDMAIDGSIYLLLKDGTAQVLLKGSLDRTISYQDYKAKIYPPTIIAGAVFTDPESPYLYISDRYVGRIIQVRKDNQPAFVRDLRGPDDADLKDLQAVVVRERQGVVYVITGASLYRGTLPPPGTEAVESVPTPAPTPTP